MGDVTHGHVLVALPVASHDVMALLLEALGEVRRDEAARARHADPELRLGPVRFGAVHTAELVAGSRHCVGKKEKKGRGEEDD